MRFARDDFTEEQLGKLFAALEDGIAMDVAARVLGDGITASMIRAYRHREPAFDERCREAQQAGQLAYQDRLRTQSRSRATDREAPSDRMLEVELATHVPEYAHLRRDRVAVDARLRHELAITFDPARLDELPPEQLRALRDVLAALDGDVVIEGKARPAAELEAGTG